MLLRQGTRVCLKPSYLQSLTPSERHGLDYALSGFGPNRPRLEDLSGTIQRVSQNAVRPYLVYWEQVNFPAYAGRDALALLEPTNMAQEQAHSRSQWRLGPDYSAGTY